MSASYSKMTIPNAWHITRMPMPDRFWGLVSVSGIDECWPWLGCIHHSGYGWLCVDYSRKQAHRMSFELSRGEIPEGLNVLHKCDNRSCCNPTHLFLGTLSDNNADRHNKGRDGWVSGEKTYNSKLNEEKVVEIRRMAKEGHSYREIASTFGIGKSVAGRIVRREDWRHVCG